MKKFLLYIFFISKICCIQVFAFQEQLQQISFDSALNLAKKNNVQIINAQIEYEIAKNNINIVSAWQNPHFVSDFFLGNVAKGNSNQLGLLFPIEVAKRGIRKNIAIDKAEIQQLQLQKIITAEINKLYLIYTTLVINKEQLKNELDFFEILKNKDIQNLEYKNFLIENQKNIINKLNETIQKRRNDFNNIFNNNTYIIYDTIDSDIYNFEFNKTDYLKKKNEQIKTEKQIINKETDSAYKNIKLTKNERIPDILAGGGFAFEYGDKPYAADYSGAFISIDLEVPQFNFIAPNIKNAELRYKQAKLRQDLFDKHSSQIITEKENQLNLIEQNFIRAKENLNKFQNSNDKEVIYSVKKEYLNSLYDLIYILFL